MAGGLTRGWIRSIDVPTLTANIFATATNRTNIHKKAGGTEILINLFNEMPMAPYLNSINIKLTSCCNGNKRGFEECPSLWN
jgi:hypothetical protein